MNSNLKRNFKSTVTASNALLFLLHPSPTPRLKLARLSTLQSETLPEAEYSTPLRTASGRLSALFFRPLRIGGGNAQLGWTDGAGGVAQFTYTVPTNGNQGNLEEKLMHCWKLFAAIVSASLLQEEATGEDSEELQIRLGSLIAAAGVLSTTPESPETEAHLRSAYARSLAVLELEAGENAISMLRLLRPPSLTA